MNIFIVLIILAAVYFFVIRRGQKIDKKVLLIGGALVLLLVFAPNIKNFVGANTYTDVPSTQVNSCGCQPGQLAIVRYNPLFGKTRTNAMTCSAALSLMSSKPKRTSLAGCTLNA